MTEGWTMIYAEIFSHEDGKSACLCVCIYVLVCVDANVCAASIILGSQHSIIFQH